MEIVFVDLKTFGIRKLPRNQNPCEIANDNVFRLKSMGFDGKSMEMAIFRRGASHRGSENLQNIFISNQDFRRFAKFRESNKSSNQNFPGQSSSGH